MPSQMANMMPSLWELASRSVLSLASLGTLYFAPFIMRQSQLFRLWHLALVIANHTSPLPYPYPTLPCTHCCQCPRHEGPAHGPQQLLRCRLRLPQLDQPLRKVQCGEARRESRCQPRFQCRFNSQVHHGMRESHQNVTSHQGNSLPRIQVHRGIVCLQGRENSQSPRHSRGGTPLTTHGTLRKASLPQLPPICR